MVRGFKFIEGNEAKKIEYMIRRLMLFSSRSCFEPLIVPLVHKEKVFTEKVGDLSEIVYHQLFRLEKKEAGESLVLRPEMTAAISELVSKLQDALRVYSFGSNFRNERPQKGRQREFIQFNWEIIRERVEMGIFDLITPCLKLFKEIGITVEFRFNCLPGASYIKTLKNYYSMHYEDLSKLSKERFKRGSILRILDSKEREDISINQNTPVIPIGEEAQILLKNIKKSIEAYGQKFLLDRTIVRGLDYYCGLVFEIFPTNEKIRSQSALGGGGAYKVLMGKQMVDAIGMAVGINRLADTFTFSDYNSIRVAQFGPDFYPISLPPTVELLRTWEGSFKKSIKLSLQHKCTHIIHKNSENEFLLIDLVKDKRETYNNIKHIEELFIQ